LLRHLARRGAPTSKRRTSPPSSRGRTCLFWLKRALGYEQLALDDWIGTVVADVAARADDPVARDQHRDPVRAHDLANCSGCSRMPDFECHLAVGAHLATGNRRNRFEHSALKRREAVEIEAHGTVVLHPICDGSKGCSWWLRITHGD